MNHSPFIKMRPAQLPDGDRELVHDSKHPSRIPSHSVDFKSRRIVFHALASLFLRGLRSIPCGYCVILSLGQVGTTPAWAAQNILLLQLSELLHLFCYARGSLSGGIMHSLR
jgi:hypothetical protein